MKKTIFIIGLMVCLTGSWALAGSDFSFHSGSIVAPLPPVTSNLQFTLQSDDKPGFIDMSGAANPGGNANKLSLKKGLLLSILVPGTGEYYAGARTKGQVFMGVEAAIWGGFIAYRVWGGWKTDDYKRIASAHASVDNNGKDDTFYDMVGFYENRDEYNQIGRLFYPDRPYYPDNDSYYWQWDSESQRTQYKQIKEDAKTAFRNSTFMLGLALANRVVSAIDTYRTIKSANRKLNSISQLGAYHFKVSPKPFDANPSVTLTVSRKF